jgi:hypothetical protein
MTDELERISQAYDEDFYDIAVSELKSSQFSEALWSKALAKSGFDEARAKGVYVDLRVEQLKSDIALEQVAIETETEEKELEKENKNLEKELDELKTEALIQNVFSSPLLIIQILLIASAAGFHQKSWGIFGVVIFALIIMMVIPVLSNIVGFLLAGLFGLTGYVLGAEWWGETGGYWAGGITFLVILGANIELLDKHKEVRNL